MLEKPHGKNLRKGRHSQAGHIYLVTFVTRDRGPIFTNLYAARAIIKSLMRARHATTLAFVIMPDHVHWLFELEEGSNLAAVLKYVKSTSARRINRIRGSKGKVWQPGYHDRALRKEEDLKEAARYIIANPIRAGMVKSVRLYPHWDATWV